jgi:hypothetical protein
VLTHHRYDLNPTFDVVVGSETFSLHTNIFTERSEFFRAARKPEWLGRNPKKPVDLEDEDPEVFNGYMNCVYVGKGSLKHYVDAVQSCSEVDRNNNVNAGFNELIQVYLLADKLQDLSTANMIIEEIKQFSDNVDRVPSDGCYTYVYSNTTPHNPLRKLMRDFWMHEMNPAHHRSADDLPRALMEDILLEFMRIKDQDWNAIVHNAFTRVHTKIDRCYYHQHNDKHPRCVTESKSG